MTDTRKTTPNNKAPVATREAMRRLGERIMEQLKPDGRLNRALTDNHVGDKEPD